MTASVGNAHAHDAGALHLRAHALRVDGRTAVHGDVDSWDRHYALVVDRYLARGMMYDPRWAWHAAEELGAETAYAPKMMACHPKLRPEAFPHRQVSAS